jgi:uncharacterized membrane protein
MKTKMLMFLTGFAGITQSAFYYTRLPERVASHFGAGGMPNDWMPKTGNLLLSSGIFLLMTGIMYFTPIFTARLPVRFINLPNKDFWLADERKEHTLADISSRMYIFGIAMNLFFIFLNHMVFLANMTNPVRLNDSAALLALGIFMFVLAGWFFSFIRRFHKPA